MSSFRQNLHKMIPCEHLTNVWHRVSQNSIFFKSGLLQIFKHQTKTSIFQTIVWATNKEILTHFFSSEKIKGDNIGV